jgi:hypothetical protein
VIDIAKKERISKKKKQLQDIRDEIDNLPSVCKISSDFEDKCFSNIIEILKVSKDHLDEKSYEKLGSHVLDLGKLHSKLKESQINDNLEILAHYLPQLKANLVRKDEKTTKRIMQRFMNSNTSNSMTISKIDTMKNDLDLMNHHYSHISSIVKDLPLEHQVLVNELRHSLFLDKLNNLHFTHRELMFHIGREFVNITRKLHK